jgi:NADH-quinone oxidoreductase subunit G
MADPQVSAAAGPGPDATVGPGVGDEPEEPVVHFTLDGRPATGRPGEMLISAAERAGTYIPRFCYHPRMKSVGVCRMCLVEVSGPRGATLTPSCFVAVAENMEVVTDSARVKKAQDGVLEFLLVNHPLDCPVCDKGGECPLQDQTLHYGPGESRFVEEKRHFEKPIAISELVLLDRERCIQCSRCTRFADEVAGEALIDFAGRGERVEVATFPGRPFSSYFSGNTVQICPVGALTATPYRFTARPWDLEQVESTCTSCAFGCRAAVQSSAGRLTRLLGIDADPVNQGWLCDKGRFAFEAVNGDVVAATASQVEGLGVHRGQFHGEVREVGVLEHGRLTEPMVRKGAELVPVSWNEALAAAAAGIEAARRRGGPDGVAVIGGARLTNEAAYAWAKLAKGVIGTDSVDAQLGDGLPAELVLGLPRATIDETCSARTVLLLCGDVREELPVLFLRLRHAVREAGTALVELTTLPTSLTADAAVSLTVRPGEAPALARALAGDAAAATTLRARSGGAGPAAAELERAHALLGDGSDVVVVLGRPSLAEHEAVVAEAARVLAAALPGARFLPALRRGNVHGALDMGLAPGLLPGRVSLDAGREWYADAWGSVPAATGRGTAAVLASLAEGEGQGIPAPGAVVLLGADPATDFPDTALARRAVDAAGFVVAVTGHPTPGASSADVILPAAVAHERAGTTTNVEGRVSRLGQKLVPPGLAWPDWMIAAELAGALGADLGVGSVVDLQDEIARLSAAHEGLSPALIDAPGSADGLLVPLARQGSRRRRPAPVDPMSLPGVDSVEHQGAPARVGLAEPGTADVPASLPAVAPARARVAPPARPPMLDARPPERGEPLRLPAIDGYALRLVAGRRLYDAGTATTGSPSLAALVGGASMRANPYDLDRLGVSDGGRVRVRSPRASLELPARSDPAVPRGVAAIDFNVPVAGAGELHRNPAGELVDAAAVVNDIRVESV